MNITILGNPDEGAKTNVVTRGVTTDAKVAKLNNDTKRPAMVVNWEKGRPSVLPTDTFKEVPKNYDSLLEKLGMSAVDYTKSVNNSGAKKLRVNKIVNEKTNRIYNSVSKESIAIPTPQEEVTNLINQINVVPAPSVAMEMPKMDEVHGRHERTGEVPVDAINEAVRQELSQTMPLASSRMERNAHEHESAMEAVKQESKAGDMDLYNDLLHSGKDDDVSRQLQGAREELTLEKEESRKLAEQYGKAVRELEELKADVENKKRAKVQQEKRELTETLNNIETLKRENLERTSDLSSIQAEIAKLKAEKEAMESVMYDGSRSFGRRAA